MRHYFLALTAFIASGAAAQFETTTTNCQLVLGTMRCTSTTPQQQQQQPQSQINWGLLNNAPNPGNSVLDGFERGQRIRLMQEQQRALAEQRRAMERQAQQQAQAQVQQQTPDPVAQALEEHKSQSWEAAKRASAGDCKGAESYALSVGNFVLAKQVKDYCGPAK